MLTNIRSAVFIEALIQRNEQANNCWLRLFAYNLSRDQKLLWLRLSDQLVDLLCSFDNKYLVSRKTTIMLHGHKPSRQKPFRAFSQRWSFAIQFIAVQQRIRMYISFLQIYQFCSNWNRVLSIFVLRIKITSFFQMLTDEDILHLSSYLVFGCLLLLLSFVFGAVFLRCCSNR